MLVIAAIASISAVRPNVVLGYRAVSVGAMSGSRLNGLTCDILSWLARPAPLSVGWAYASAAGATGIDWSRTFRVALVYLATEITIRSVQVTSAASRHGELHKREDLGPGVVAGRRWSQPTDCRLRRQRAVARHRGSSRAGQDLNEGGQRLIHRARSVTTWRAAAARLRGPADMDDVRLIVETAGRRARDHEISAPRSAAAATKRTLDRVASRVSVAGGLPRRSQE